MTLCEMSNDIALQIIRYVTVISFVLLRIKTSRLAHPPERIRLLTAEPAPDEDIQSAVRRIK